MPSWALEVCRLGAIHSARAATMNSAATPVAPHLNFSRRAMRSLFQSTPRLAPNFLEGRGGDHIAARHAYDGEGLVERRHDLIVLVKWRIRDIDHVVGLHAKLLGHEDRHRLVEVETKHPSPRPRVLQVAHAEDENAGIDLRGPAVWHAGPR